MINEICCIFVGRSWISLRRWYLCVVLLHVMFRIVDCKNVVFRFDVYAKEIISTELLPPLWIIVGDYFCPMSKMASDIRQVSFYRLGLCMLCDEYILAINQRLSWRTISYFERSACQFEECSFRLCRYSYINLSIIYFAMGDYRKCLDHALLAGKQDKTLTCQGEMWANICFAGGFMGIRETVAGTICYQKAEQLMSYNNPIESSAKIMLQNIAETFPSLKIHL